MSDVFSISCPYNCGHSHDISAVAGFQLITCDKCGKPWVMETHYVPLMQARTVDGFGRCAPKYPTPEEIEEDAKYYAEHPEELDEITESMKQPLTDETINDVRKWANVLKCVECGKPISPDSDWRLCEDCLEDDEHEKTISTNSVFVQCPNAPNSLYRLDGDYVVVKYKKGASIRTTWSDIHMMCEDENPTPTIKELLGERANTNNVAAVNAFVRAVKNGLIEADA